MSNAELLVTVQMQTATAYAATEDLARYVTENDCVLKHEAVGTLNTIVARLNQAHCAAMELQNRAKGNPPARVGD